MIAPPAPGSQGEPIQQVAAEFFGPVVLTYLLVCAAWWCAFARRPQVWPQPELPATERPWLDLALGLVAAALVLGIGRLYDAGLLLPQRGEAARALYVANMLIVWSPLGLVLLLRRASLATVLLTPERWWLKVGTGIVVGLAGTVVFLALRGELARLPGVLREAVAPRALSHFVPVFLEGVGVAFLWMRLRWVGGTALALLIPCVLFAVAHVPQQVQRGAATGEIAAFFALNTLLPLAIFATVVRSRDVIWLGIVHYLIDVPAGAFG